MATLRKDGRNFETEHNGGSFFADDRPLTHTAARDISERRRAAERWHPQELRARYNKIERFNCVAVGQELRMIELKREVNALGEGLGEAIPYPQAAARDVPPAPEPREEPR